MHTGTYMHTYRLAYIHTYTSDTKRRLRRYSGRSMLETRREVWLCQQTVDLLQPDPQIERSKFGAQKLAGACSRLNTSLQGGRTIERHLCCV